VKIIQHPIDDLWIRDTGPTFVTNKEHKLGGIDLNFNGWGSKQTHELDADVARFVCKYAHAERIQSSLVLEGGALETDGEGTAILTESCILNDNRNPGRSKSSVEKELKHLFHFEKIIWLPGIKNKDITDAHTDFYARFIKPGLIVVNLDNDPESYDYAVTRRHLAILKKATDAQGRKLEIETLIPPENLPIKYQTNEYFAAGYVNFYVGNGFVIMPKFGDKAADEKAYKTIKKCYPERKIEQVEIFGIASGGGGIHCATQQQIKV
jgi:agmatine deiminase